MPPKKERYNAKARQSVAGGHTHKKGKGKSKPIDNSTTTLDPDAATAYAHPDAHPQQQSATPTFDPNALILDEQAKEQDRQRRLLLAQAGNDASISLSSKKKKRLDKYIASRLKKQERGQILAKLEHSSQSLAHRTDLKSAATLGTGKVRSLGERVDKLIGKEQRVGSGGIKKRKRAAAFDVDEDDDDADLDEREGQDKDQDGDSSMARLPTTPMNTEPAPPPASTGASKQTHTQTPPPPPPSSSAAALAPLPLPTTIGSALALGPDGKPLVTVRKKRARKIVRKAPPPGSAAAEREADEDDNEDENANADAGPVSAPQAGPSVSASTPSPSEPSTSTSRPLLEMAAAITGPDEIQRTEEGETLRPLLGYSVKVKELMDPEGVARGPLGEKELRMDETSAFSKKVYEEFRKAFPDPAASSSSSKRSSSTSEERGLSLKTIVRNVGVKRSEDLMAARMCLPIVAEEDKIIKTILENPVVVICGETGSGKTTQVPQFLYEAGFGTPGSLNPGMIGITQPRRVAALSTAARVRSELSLPESRVSHQIRYDATVSPQTSIKFMTDGVLLREVATDFLLDKYSAILVDEAHERSVNTDVLIGVLSRIVRLREKRWLEARSASARPLRLIIMSATLRVADFTQNKTLFPEPPPVLNIEARQHPVTVHFNRRTTHDFMGEAIKKVGKIHTRLPPGGILVFLTGQQEIMHVCKTLEAKFGRKAIARRKERATGLHWAKSALARSGGREEQAEEGEDAGAPATSADKANVEAEDVELNARPDQESAPLPDTLGIEEGEIQDADALDTDSETEGDDEDEDADVEDGENMAELGLGKRDLESDVPLHILPLYSLLPSDKQMRVFEDPPLDARVVVVATNVAETSLTIPGIRYVVDCGRAKERQYDLVSGVQSFEVGWISKASAAQRAGRAGRTGPGHAYRLYSSAMYEDHFEEFSSPEIVRTPVEGLVLSMKAMNIDQVIHFPFPTPPDRRTVADAERALVRLGALEEAKAMLSDGGASGGTKRPSTVARVTDLGRVMSYFPVAPRFGKMLVQGRQHGCLPYVVAIVAALTVGDPFIHENVLDHGDGDDANDGEEQDEDGEGEDGQSSNKRRKKKKEGLKGLLEEGGDVVDPDALIAAGLKSKQEQEKQLRKLERKRYFQAHHQFSLLGNGISDIFKLLSVVSAYEEADEGSEFCDRNFLRAKAMEEIHKLRAQLSSLVTHSLPGLDTSSKQKLQSAQLDLPSDMQLKVLRQLLCAAFIDQVAVRADLIDSVADLEAEGSLSGGGGGHGWLCKNGGIKSSRMKSTRGIPYRALGLSEREAAYIHPSSALYHHRPPEWIIFSERHRSAPPAQLSSKQAAAAGLDSALDADQRRGRVWLKTCTVINPGWLSSLGKKMCTFSKPTTTGAASSGSSAQASNTASLVEALRAAKAKAKGGAGGQEESVMTREVVLIPSFGAGMGAAGLGWELPPIKATQTLVDGRWVTNA
ncbi:putative ATP-dependent RNA helicase DHR1 [Tilletia horrida]|uniref:ATP-dependent RNA helicase DHR1 n=1 Tax=Tilletia horrida TaxID=155126 RepID=A0AAN6JPZ4_9BASI|nr:putative ATP-dependent RNA helicase DHR1 [Tilletia horrida]KAK0545359.1 putative ATP-dependent RNA helicase DHR1 [Tilletia horrida]KAK0561302.1 putative ATP-dependent RNA helicase DHR1 [Tilletia horrida]